MRNRAMRRLAGFLVLPLLFAACSRGGDVEQGSAGFASGEAEVEPNGSIAASDDTDESVDRPVDCTGSGSFELAIGAIFPDGASSAPVRTAAAELAVEDINAAGGVFGADVRLAITGVDSDEAVLKTQVNDLIEAENIDALLAVVGSASSIAILDDVTNRGVIHISPNNTSALLTDLDVNNLYFRTAPSDALQGRVLSDEMISAGRSRAAVIYLDDAYGSSLATEFRANFEAGDRRVELFLPFESDSTDFGSLVDEVSSANPDAVLVIGYDADSAAILELLHLSGLGPTAGAAVWGVDGNANVVNELTSGPEILAGMRQTVPSADVTAPMVADYLKRLKDRVGDPNAPVSFTPETYDAVTVVALAAVAADCDDPAAIAGEINDVTRVGTKCSTFADCRALLAEGTDIDFDGLGGVYEFGDNGEPTLASYRLDTYGPNGPDRVQEEYVSGRVCLVCEVNEFPGIDFASGSSELSPEVFATLNRVANVLNRPDVGVVEVQGYSSPDGNPEANQRLSEERAAAVVEYLVNQGGVSPEKLVPKGFGATDEFPQNKVVVFEETEVAE